MNSFVYFQILVWLFAIAIFVYLIMREAVKHELKYMEIKLNRMESKLDLAIAENKSSIQR